MGDVPCFRQDSSRSQCETQGLGRAVDGEAENRLMRHTDERSEAEETVVEVTRRLELRSRYVFSSLGHV